MDELKKLLAEINEKVSKSASVDTVKQMISDAIKESHEAVKKSKANVQTELIQKSAGVVAIHKSSTKKDEYIQFQKKADDVYITAQLMGVNPRSLNIYKEMVDLGRTIGIMKGDAMDDSETGYGAEWIPTNFSADMIDKIRLELKVAALHPRIVMPTDPFKIPGKNSDTSAKLATGGVAPSAQKVGTRSITLDAVKLMDYVPVTYEIEEDSIIPILPLVKEDLVIALATGIEDATINGDTTATHQDSDVTSSDDCRKAWKGYRKLVLSAAKVDLSTISDANVRSIRKKLGKYGVDVSKLAYVTGISGFNQLLGLTEVRTVDKYGQYATVLSGELAKLDGIPIIVSEKVRENLNASGVYDGTTTTKTVLMLVRRDGFIYGDRKEVVIETDRMIKTQTTDIVASQRIAFEPRYDATTETIVGLGYNITA